jgi:hypothetical protein
MEASPTAASGSPSGVDEAEPRRPKAFRAICAAGFVDVGRALRGRLKYLVALDPHVCSTPPSYHPPLPRSRRAATMPRRTASSTPSASGTYGKPRARSVW